MQIHHVTILGLTRTTCSIGLILRQLFHGEGLVVGHSPHEADVKQALALDALDQTPKNWRDTLAQTDLLIIDWPAPDLETLYREIGFRLRPETLVLDFSRLKSPVYQLAQAHLKSRKFIGVAPLLAANQLANGATTLAAATPKLFAGSHFCLVAHPTTTQETLDQAIAFGRLLGAEPTFADPWEYDGLMQMTELLPILSAAAIFQTASRSEGWEDVGRFAGLTFAGTTNALDQYQEAIWMVAQNQTAILPLLDNLVTHLQQLRHLITQDDAAALPNWLNPLSQTHARWLQKRLTSHPGEPDLLDEVQDRNFLRQLFTFKRRH